MWRQSLGRLVIIVGVLFNPDRVVDSSTTSNIPSALRWKSPEEVERLLNMELERYEIRALSQNLCAPLACYYAGTLLLGKDLDLVDLIGSCNISDSDDYGDMASIKTTCEAMGFQTKASYEPNCELKPEMLPAILHYDKPTPHFELVVYIRQNGYVVSISFPDYPAYTVDEHCERWSGYILMLNPRKSSGRKGMFGGAAIAVLCSLAFVYVTYRAGKASAGRAGKSC